MDEPLIQIIFYNDPDGYPPIVNGIRVLAQAGWQVEVLCRDSTENWNVAYPAEAKVIRIGAEGRGSWQEYMAFVTRVLRYGSKHASLIYAHDMHALVPARMLATIYRRPLVYHSHDFAEEHQSMPMGSRIVYAFQKRFARMTDQVIIPDADRAKVISRALRLKREPLIVANAPLDRPLTTSSILHQVLAARNHYFEKILFRQGRIGVGHAIEATLRSIPYWSKQNWGFVVMGIGEPSYVEKLKRDAHELGIDRQFVVLPPVGYDQVAEFTTGANFGHALYEPIHINNVHITTASNKIMEYMAAGLPLLASNTSAMREFVNQYKCGLLAQENVPESIAAAVNTLFGDSEQVDRMGRAARMAFEKHFCYERQFEPAMEYFRGLLMTASADSNACPTP
jgi:glycosyltransferase involved in cell wall biosynthesis